MNCYRIHKKSLNFIYPFKFYSNFTNKNVSWLHFSWATQYTLVTLAWATMYLLRTPLCGSQDVIHLTVVRDRRSIYRFRTGQPAQVHGLSATCHTRHRQYVVLMKNI